MRLSREQLKQIIKEELEAVMNEEVMDEVRGTKGPEDLNPAEEIKDIEAEIEAAKKAGNEKKVERLKNDLKLFKKEE